MAREIPKGSRFWKQDQEVLPASDIVRMYEAGFAGAWRDDAAKATLLAAVGWPDGDKAAHEFGIADSAAGQLVPAWMGVERLFPGCWPGSAQTRGDCFPAGTMVRMGDGSEKPIEQVELGDMVMSPKSGLARKVIDLIAKPFEGELVRISVEGYAKPISATPDHRFVTYPAIRPNYRSSESQFRNRSEATDWTAIGDLSKGDHVLLPRVISQESTQVFDLAECPGAVTEGVPDRLKGPSAIGLIRSKGDNFECRRYVPFEDPLAWLIGLYLAEGSMCRNSKGQPKRVTLNLCKDESLLAEQAAQAFLDLFGVKARVGQVPSKPNVLYVRVHSKPVAWLFSVLAGGNTYSKRVPWQVFSCPRSTRLLMLRGWMDGDGHLDLGQRSKGPHYRCKLTGVSASSALADGMHSLANSCGLRATTTSRKARNRSKPATDVHMYGMNALGVYPDLETDCKVRIVKRDYRITSLGLAAKVRTTERIPFEGTVYCIGVETDHAFIADGYAVHNCVSHSTRNGGLTAVAGDILSGIPDAATGKVEAQPEDISEQGKRDGIFSTEAIYWWRDHGGDGWSCGHASSVLRTESGLWVRKNYESLGVDLSKYSGSTAGKYGSKAPPADYLAEGAKHRIREVTEVSSFDQVRDFLANGYGISTCGGEGWSSSRDENGFSKRQGGWSHALAMIGADDRDVIKQKYGEPLVLILNSWGTWNSGGTKVLGTDLNIPAGSFWAKWSDASRRDMYAYSGVNGWPRRKISFFGTSKKWG